MNALSRRTALACVASAAVATPTIATALPVDWSPDALLIELSGQYTAVVAEHRRLLDEYNALDENSPPVFASRGNRDTPSR